MSTVGTPYRGKSGQWAFMLHRITGFLVFMFLMLHIVDVSLVQNKHLYNALISRRPNQESRQYPLQRRFSARLRKRSDHTA